MNQCVRSVAGEYNIRMFYILITDLDGSFIDHITYDYSPALPALEELRKRRIPVVFCSSKTAAEMIALREAVGNSDPFIVENGGGVYIPRHYFPGIEEKKHHHHNDYWVIRLGARYQDLQKAIEQIGKELNWTLLSFADMSPHQLVQETGLSLQQAERSLQRDFDLPFTIKRANRDLERLEKAARRLGLKLTKGARFFHLTGHSDKGKAAIQLVQLYQKQWREPVQAIGVGDSQNDLGLLLETEIPIVIPNPHSEAPLLQALPHARRAPFPGPRGWNAAILALLRDASIGNRQ